LRFSLVSGCGAREGDVLDVDRGLLDRAGLDLVDRGTALFRAEVNTYGGLAEASAKAFTCGSR